MAKIGEVLKVLEPRFGLSPALLQLYARVLRESGARTKDNRGRGVGAIDARDIAQLLIAIVGSSERPKDALTALTQYGLLTPGGRQNWESSLQFLPVPSIIALPSDHTLSDALTALLQSLSEGELKGVASSALGREADLESLDPDVYIEVLFSAPRPTSAIKITLNNERGPDGVPTANCAFVIVDYWELKSRRPGTFDVSYLSDPRFDLRLTQTFGQDTLIALSQLLGGDK
jgi:hypothetical protein